MAPLAMNSRFDNAESLTGYLRRYASEYFEEYKMPMKFTATDEALDKISLSGERRRNIFLVFKETLHNTIKYAHASAVEVMVSTGENFEVHITETGALGFDPEAAKEKGNGLFNSQKRMAAIGGDIRYEKTPEAMHIILSLPLKQPTHEQT
jgi:signal transduction histidine kinase